MKKNYKSAAILWDESYLYGIWLYYALLNAGIEFDILKASEIEKLENYEVLFVPGGWASNKLKALGTRGVEFIKDFVRNSGIYFGICGGAGLATYQGINLTEIKRKKQRVPAFSGKVRVKTSPHPFWQGISVPEFYLWWPSELLVEESEKIRVLARFEKALDSAFSSDLPIKDFKNLWKNAEKIYGIFLNPERMKNTPLFLEVPFKKGMVYMSLMHFDTPKDKNGLKVLKNVKKFFKLKDISVRPTNPGFKKTKNDSLARSLIKAVFKEVQEIMNFGERNLLWFKRSSYMYHWKRGIRGSEFVNLWFMTKTLKDEILSFSCTGEWLKTLEEIIDEIKDFLKTAKELLLMEKLLLYQNKLSNRENQELDRLRSWLFGRKKSYGGFYKSIIKGLDEVIYEVLKTKLNLIKGLHSIEKV